MAIRSKKSVLTATALAVSSMALMVDLAIYPAADAIFTTYADCNQVLVNFIITGPSLMVIFSSIASGFLTQVAGKKQLLVGSYIVFLIATVCCPLVDSVYYLAAMRALAGITEGIISVTSMGLIAELFVDEKRRSRVTGVYVGLTSLFGAILSFSAGYLALSGWTHVFRIYWIALPIILMIIFFVPATPPEGRKAKDADEAVKEDAGEFAAFEKMQWSRPIALGLAAFVLNATYAGIFTMLAVFFAEEGIGDSAVAGTFSSLATLGSMVFGFLFGVIFMRVKRFTPALCAILMALMFFVIAGVREMSLLAFAITLQGGMYGLSYSYYLCYASLIVPASKASLSISIANAAVYAGLFVGPYVCPLFEGVLGFSTMAPCMPYLGAVCVVYAILSVVVVLATRKKRMAEGTM